MGFSFFLCFFFFWEGGALVKGFLWVLLKALGIFLGFDF